MEEIRNKSEVEVLVEGAVQPEGTVQRDKKEEGATMLEYALLAALIAVVCIVGITFLGRSACQTFSTIGGQMQGALGN